MMLPVTGRTKEPVFIPFFGSLTVYIIKTMQFIAQSNKIRICLYALQPMPSPFYIINYKLIIYY